ncbi:MAG: hypothetical protein U0W40_20805 [Acidimicrobiia bacterium]
MSAPTPHTHTRFPYLTTAALFLTAAATATRLRTDDVLHALRRDPDALGAGQVWRLITPVLVQSDRSAAVVLATFVFCAAIGVLGERVLPRALWVTLYVTGALIGHGIGEVIQPREGGTSVAFAAILGGLAATVLRRDVSVPTPIRVEAALLVPLAVLDTVLGDIHGLPFLAGTMVTLVWCRIPAGRISRRCEPEAGRGRSGCTRP